MLCFLCRKIQIKSIRSKWTLQHHLSFEDLTEAADDGCELCELFKTALLFYYAEKRFDGVLEAAETYHQELDNEDSEEVEANHRVFFVVSILADIDDRFGPFPEGASGLLFLRCALRHENNLPFAVDVNTFLQFSIKSDRNSTLDGCIAGREVARTPDFSLGRSWIRECVEVHEECRHPQESQLPPRIIDVGQADGSEVPRLVLCDGCVGDFATLSHCWGDSKPMVTNSKTFEAHMKGIPYANLPKTFQHAVIATRELGLKYLWIDSLCIIQDSQEDWERHCSKMPEIYRNSIVTIAGPGASNCNAGFLQNRCAPLQADLKVSNGEIDETITLSHYGVRSSSYPDLEKDSPLAKRAWVLQERLLSRRVLYFGSEFMYFECCTNVRHESLRFPFVDDYQLRGEVPKMAFTTSEQDSSFWLQYWTQIVDTYSDAALTFPSDRLPAISGIAKAIQQKLQDTYLAGLWLTDMPRGLTWYNNWLRNYDTLAQSSNNGALPYMAPSWSWASVTYGVSYCIPNYSAYQFVSESLQIVGHDIEVRGLDPLGEVSRGVLILRGRLQNFIIRNGSQLWAGGSSRGLHVCSSQSLDPLAQFYPDSLNRFQPQQTSADSSLGDNWSEQPITLLYLGQFKRRQEWKDSILLAIEAIPGTEGQYRRVGLGIGSSEKSPI